MHIDYYLYLFKISWPALSGLFLVCIFIGIKCLSILRKALAEKNYFSKFLAAAKSLFLVLIVFIYSLMFMDYNQDWLNDPAVSKGVIESLTAEAEQYTLILRSGEEILTLSIDAAAFHKLHKNDLVEVTYLHQKKQVVQCSVLTRQADNFI